MARAGSVIHESKCIQRLYVTRSPAHLVSLCCCLCCCCGQALRLLQALLLLLLPDHVQHSAHNVADGQLCSKGAAQGQQYDTSSNPQQYKQAVCGA